MLNFRKGLYFRTKSATGENELFRKQLYFRKQQKIYRFYSCLAGRQERTLFSVYNVAAITLARIALALQVDLYYLLGLSDEPEPWK